jgi:hypothetical protein
MSNTIYIPRPTQDQYNSLSCKSGCGNGGGSCGGLGPTDPIYNIGPRKNREKVREQIKDYVLTMLGAPVLPLELDDQQLENSIDFSLQIFEDYAPAEYFQYYSFYTSPGQSVYELPPDVGFVRQISYKETANYAFSASDLGGVIPLEYMGAGAYGSIAGGINPQQPVWGKMSDWVLYKQYEDMYNRISGQQGGWEYLGGYRHVKLYPVPYRTYPVIVRYLQRKPDFQIVTQAMQEGALAFAKIILGRIRSRIGNPPGPGGGVQLDGAVILAEGIQDKKDFEERLLVRFGDLLPIKMM